MSVKFLNKTFVDILSNEVYVDDFQWVRAVMAPMQLGLLDRSFVSHNLISAHESPVPLTNFQIASRLKTLMSSGSKKGTQIH
jgi:hypothetical protein